MAETISYLAVITPRFSETTSQKVDGEIKVALSVLSTTHRNALERYLTKLAGTTLVSDSTAFAAVVTAINALA